MKTFSPGLSDSIASVVSDPRPCPHCDSSSHIAGGLCVGCLLEAGLDPGDESESEALSDILAEVRLPDQNWRLGNYEILEEIGRGGMGVIYRARQRHSRRIVAVKRVLSYHSDSRETLARFRREAQAAASLDHPNILPIYEVSESDDGLPFFSMKFAPGGSLQQVAPALRSEPRQCVALVAKIARAVQYAHSRGILHRDLKPGNILLDARGEPLVSDFGLAKWLDTTSDLTRTLTIFGTPGYIAPEQASAAADETKPAADTYSLGAILFDLLTGRPPFLGTHAFSVIRQAAESPAPKLRSLSRLADRDLETICSRCLEREPCARYPSAHDLAEDLERWLEGRPIIARPVWAPIKLWRWSKRNPLLASIAAICVVLGTMSVAWGFQRRQLTAQVRQEQIATHSIAVLPFLEIDKVEVDVALTRLVADVLSGELQRIGPSRIAVLKEMPPRWTGIGTDEEVNESARLLQCGSVLSGTLRTLPAGVRLSLRLTRPATGEVLGEWVFEAITRDIAVRETRRRSVAREIYELADGARIGLARAESSRDPIFNNDKARELMTAGRWLIDRGRSSVGDIDRAIGCLESAVRLEPGSATARAYLAMACLARDVNASNPALAKRALVEAREAVRLGPRDAVANRALRAVLVTNGHYSEALEHGLHSLEVGEPSERTFGHIAYAWMMLGRPDKAIGWYRKAKGTGQQLADYEALLGDCWLALGMDEQARDAYEKSTRLRSDLPDGWAGLCHMALLRHDFAGARTMCLERLIDYPDSPHLRRMLAQIEFFSRNFTGAEQLYRELSKGDPLGGTKGEVYGAVDYRSALVCLESERGQTAENKALLRQYAQEAEAQAAEEPESSPTFYQLAAIEAMLGDKASSLKHLHSAFRLGWLDYRSPRLDPRFDSVSSDARFEEILCEMETRLAGLRNTKGTFDREIKTAER
jgi:tetratricopeptide (TPR) repeat protein/tRNA A-37 threonylcarbamoyl transferase component Bud32/TolB-like protein